MNIGKLVWRAIQRGWKAFVLAILTLVLLNNSITSFLQMLIQGGSLTFQKFTSIWISGTLEMFQGIQSVSILTVGLVSAIGTIGYYLWHNFRSQNFDGEAGILAAAAGGISVLFPSWAPFPFPKIVGVILVVLGLAFVGSQSN